ncbi:Protein ACR-18, partial [Aphelenchoides avenae]
MPRTTEVFSRSLLARSLFWSILYGLFVITGTTTESVTTGGTAKAASTTVSARRGGERHMKLLYDYLFLDYQREIRPVYNDSKPITVTVQFWLKQILKVNERDQTLNIYCWLELYWKDELLTWDPAEFGGLDRIHVPSTKIWKPDILVYNNANMNVEDNELETNAIIKSNGEVTLFRAMITDIACTLSLSLFPFDQQVCYLIFASWSMDGSKLLLYPMNDTDNLELYIRNTEWDLTDFAVKSYEKIYDCCPYAFP